MAYNFIINLYSHIVTKSFKLKSDIPGTIDNEIAQGAQTFLNQMPSHHKSQSMADLRTAPMKVLRDKDGMYIRRTLLGDATEYQKALKKIKDMRRYSYNRKRQSQKGRLNNQHGRLMSLKDPTLVSHLFDL